MSTIVDVPQR